MNVSLSNNRSCARLITSASHNFLLVNASGKDVKDVGTKVNSIHDISSGSLYRIKSHETTHATYEYMYRSKQGEYTHLSFFYYNLLLDYNNNFHVFRTNILLSRRGLF